MALAVSIFKLVCAVGAPVAILAYVYYRGKSSGDKETWALAFAAVALLLATVVMCLVPSPSQSKSLQGAGPAADAPLVNPPPAQDPAPVAGPSAAATRNLFSGLYVGWDGRWSTSKVQALLWTYTIAFALIALLVASNYGVKPPGSPTKDIFGDLSFDDTYLLLLGGPFAAMVLAKGITSMKTQDGTVTKTTIDQTRTLDQGLRDIIADDGGATDIGDFQFFVFNLITLAYFYSKFLGHSSAGLPVLPTFLVGLTSTSALAYVGKKAVESSQSSISSSSAFPAIDLRQAENIVVHDVLLTITGQNLQLASGESPVVIVGSVTVVAKALTPERIQATLAAGTAVVVTSGTELAITVVVGATAKLTDSIGVRFI